jgi:ankyrin repeat protein
MSDGSDVGPGSRSGPPSEADLRAALDEGDPQRVSALIEAGADIRYKADHGYDALLDAVHGRDVLRDPRLLDLLALLVARGVDLSGVSAYGESGLRRLSWLGRFDAVRLLLDAGADKRQLGWTPLMEAVALGSLAGVQAALGQGAALEERDCWSRTAWLIALLTGDIAKAKLLRERGADPNARGRCGRPPLFYAIQGHHPDMLRWLLQGGADVHQTDEFGTTALIEAVLYDDLECVEILLDAGADVEANPYGTALRRARSREIIMRLLDAGADPADADQRVILGLPDVGDDALTAVSPEGFRRTFTRSFGEGNPTRMRVPFWEAMIHSGVSAYGPRERFEASCGPVEGPVWCAERFGQSLTLLPGGRAVQIGGEHEDWYDADFCIYNDVFVYERDRSVAIYGYPESVFPPTDFHTATLIGDSIYVIGCLGYPESRRPGETPVYRLDLRTLRMERLDTRGEAPGWIYRHRAAAVGLHEIRVWGRTVATGSGGGEAHGPNLGSFVLDLDRLLWRREPAAGAGS